MAEYDNVRAGKLVLKGEKQKNKKRKHKSVKQEKKAKIKKGKIVDEDAIIHGGWWKILKVSDITGSVALEFGDRTYLKALDNGLFTLGAPHANGEPPSPEEIFTSFPINDSKIALKSGYGKYLKHESNGIVTGRSDAVGCKEQWEPVFDDGKMALLSDSGCFMSIDPEDDACVAIRKKAGDLEIVKIRCCTVKEEVSDDEQIEEKGDNMAQIEINYVKKFQKFQDKKLRINKNDIKELEVAKEEGVLHEALLDRRSKMKADRYCK